MTKFVICCVYLTVILSVRSECKMRIAVIGGGAAGLVSAKHALANGYECDVFEGTAEIGGTWVYTPKTGNDEFGFPIHSAMYKGLRTNLPKEVMDFPELRIVSENRSYIDHQTVLNYLHLYAEKFNLKEYIKFNRLVTDVAYVNNSWSVTTLDKTNNSSETDDYDIVMVCSGHYSKPFVPILKGVNGFSGDQMHSHLYRTPESYKNKTVLVIGGGPSGIDLTYQISEVASKVIFSHHMSMPIKLNFSENVEVKPDVENIVNDTVVLFTDGSTSTVDAILYCTGYSYSFPFLDKSVGITVENNQVRPLYKHVINISNPKICFIGIPSNVVPFRMFDIQVGFYMQYLNGKMKLPSREAMLEDVKLDLERRKENVKTKTKPHSIGPHFQKEYFDDMANLANIPLMPLVLSKIYEENIRSVINNLSGFREDRYEVIDEETFRKFK